MMRYVYLLLAVIGTGATGARFAEGTNPGMLLLDAVVTAWFLEQWRRSGQTKEEGS